LHRALRPRAADAPQRTLRRGGRDHVVGHLRRDHQRLSLQAWLSLRPSHRRGPALPAAAPARSGGCSAGGLFGDDPAVARAAALAIGHGLARRSTHAQDRDGVESPCMRRHLTAILAIALFASSRPAAQQPDWKAVEHDAIKTLQDYVRINTSNPPGDVTKAADFLIDILKREGIPVTRYESGPGRSIVLARLKGSGTGGKAILLESHMDVVPTDPSRWSADPFGAQIADGRMWGRGTIDMKGIGTSYLYAFIMLHRLQVPLTRDVLLLFVPDEEVGGAMGAEWMRKNHYAELDPEYVIDEGGFGSREMFTAGKLVFGISVAEKKIMWLKLRAEGVAGHGSQPHGQNPNEHLMRALARLFAEPIAAAPFPVVDTMKQRIGGPLTENKFNNAIQHSTISLTSLRSGVGDPPKVNVIPSVAEAT